MMNYVVTDVGSKIITQLADKMKVYDEKEELSIQGESKIVDGYMNYILDEDSLQSVILQLFYEEKES
jgi:uncharacterized protein YqeY